MPMSGRKKSTLVDSLTINELTVSISVSGEKPYQSFSVKAVDVDTVTCKKIGLSAEEAIKTFMQVLRDSGL